MSGKTVKPSQRAKVLERRQDLKMARSAETYVRGTPVKFYEWLQTKDGEGVPKGPPVWICGDCHLGNLGPLANVKGEVEIAIRDFDQSVIGNPAHDLIRLALSLATAARGSDLSGITTADMIEAMIDAYDKALSHPKLEYKDFTQVKNLPEPVKEVFKEAVKREWAELMEEDLDADKPRIPLGKQFWPLTREEKQEIEALFEQEHARQFVASLHCEDEEVKVRALDAAYWRKGCSSLGNLRYAVLLHVGKGHSDDGLCLIDIKEAVKPAAPRAGHRKIPGNNAERVIQGACHMSPYLGERMRPATILHRQVFVRELMPQDLKIEMDALSREEAVSTAAYLAMVLGKAHGRQMDLKTRTAWRAELNRHRPRNLNAPSWLWTSVVKLIAIHDTAYLEHCRHCKIKEEEQS